MTEPRIRLTEQGKLALRQIIMEARQQDPQSIARLEEILGPLDDSSIGIGNQSGMQQEEPTTQTEPSSDRGAAVTEGASAPYVPLATAEVDTLAAFEKWLQETKRQASSSLNPFDVWQGACAACRAASGAQRVTADQLATIIRFVDGEHKLGAGELAERIFGVIALAAPTGHALSEEQVKEAETWLVRARSEVFLTQTFCDEFNAWLNALLRASQAGSQ